MSTEKIEEIKITQTVEQKAIAKEAEELLLKAESVKKKWGAKRVFFIEIEDEFTGDWVGAWIRKPNLKEFSMFTKLAEKDNLAALKILMENVFLEGNKDVYEDDDNFMGAIAQVQEIVNVQASRIKKF